MKSTLDSLTLFLSLTSVCITSLAAETLTLKVWPEGAPGKMLPHSEATEAFLNKHTSKNTLTDIAEPEIVVYRPDKPNGTSVIVAPGGGYIFLSAVHEGTQVCEWLNTLGVTGILLKYRTPTRDEAAPHEKPVQDARQALKLVRKHAKEWNLNPQRVGLLGFSAGGNLLGHLACDRGTEKKDVPDFGIMIYGGGFLDAKDPTKLKADFTVPPDAPPMFFACAHNDGSNPVAMTLLYLEYKKRGIPAEIHLFTEGGHGFGMRDNKQPINQWPVRCAEWMNAMKWLPNVALLEDEIRHQQSALVRIGELLKSEPAVGFSCGIEFTQPKQMKNEQQELEQKLANGHGASSAVQAVATTRKIKELRDKITSFEKALKEAEELAGKMKPETLMEDVNTLKKQIIENHLERDRLLGLEPQPQK